MARRILPPPPRRVTPRTDDVLPDGLIASTLNSAAVRSSRTNMHTGEYRLHVSDLMKSDTQHQFCPRHYVMQHLDPQPKTSSGLSPGFELLFSIGHAVHDHVRDLWMARSPYGALAWGGWVCGCGQSTQVGLKPPAAHVCKNCGTPHRKYAEFDLVYPRLRLVGHPDFLILWNGRLVVVEIKTVERADIVFDTLEGPLGDHTLQASIYYWMLRHMYDTGTVAYEPYPAILYIYVDRSSSKLFRGKPFREFKHPPSELGRVEHILARANAVAEGIDKRKLPDRICKTFRDTRAKNCDLITTCFG